MRALTAALFLAACAPPAPPAARAPEADAPVDLGAGSIRRTETRAMDRAALAGAMTQGEWIFWGSEPEVSACFDTANAECILAIQCDRPTGIVTLHYAYELSPDQWTSFRIITQTHVLDLPGRSVNDDGAPRVDAHLADGTYERQIVIDHLAPAQERFAVDIWNDVQVFPWRSEIARALDACR
ncbi:MAG: hypothetical protein AB7H66_11370 [Hyphomonadaceae bacterium]